jgi:hypothetical protein
MRHTKRQISGMVCAIACGVVGVVLLGGCSEVRRRPINAGSALVFERVGDVERTRAGMGRPAYERFEFARHDAQMQVRVPAAILATRQWPVPRAPKERRVRFHYWEQR